MIIRKISYFIVACLLVIFVSVISGTGQNLSAAEDDDKISMAEEFGMEEQTEAERQQLIDQYEESLLVYQQFTDEFGENYNYTRSFGSWTGWVGHTTIHVEDGVVVSRFYETYNMQERDSRTNQYRGYETYTETGDDIGDHSRGYPAVTLSDLYEECSVILTTSDLGSREIWFVADDKGIMSSCGYYPYGCLDDCSEGVNLSQVTFGE